MLTDIGEGDGTLVCDFSDHVPQEIRAPPHDTLHDHDIVPGLVIFTNSVSSTRSATFHLHHFSYAVVILERLTDTETSSVLLSAEGC